MGVKPTKKNTRRRRSRRNHNKKRIDISSEALDYKNPDMLKKFLTERGKILPRRITGMPSKLHRKLVREIKRARNVLLVK
ncbi:MAG: 30S ribosomal protein S18 [Verrucomicrobiales bacterium]|jgi:small subunit ribosomal protein S18|nr:30S ribosomal protein S18 [Verrucomicrobiales bacterium]